MTPQEQEQTRDVWDKLAAGFDEFATPLTIPLAEEALRRADLRPGMGFLDVAAGSGALSIPAARLGAQVLATDIAPTMSERLNERARDEGNITYQDDRAATYPYGVAGGKPGSPSKKTLVRKSGEEIGLPSKVRDVPVFEGDRLVFETAGAGGVGDPLERDPEAVAKDVRWNLVGREAAENEYGVVVDEDGQVDASASESKREEIRGSRGELLDFDHGSLPPLEEQRRNITETRRKFNEWLSQELGGTNGR